MHARCEIFQQMLQHRLVNLHPSELLIRFMELRKVLRLNFLNYGIIKTELIKEICIEYIIIAQICNEMFWYLLKCSDLNILKYF